MGILNAGVRAISAQTAAHLAPLASYIILPNKVKIFFYISAFNSSNVITCPLCVSATLRSVPLGLRGLHLFPLSPASPVRLAFRFRPALLAPAF